MKLFHSILFRGVSFYLLAFILFIILYFRLLTEEPTSFILFVSFGLFGLFLVVYILMRFKISARKATRQLNHFLPENVVDQLSKKNLSELELIYEQSQALKQNLSLPTDRLEDQVQQLDNILSYITAGLIATDRKGQIILANSPVESLLDVDIQSISCYNLLELLNLSDQYSFHQLVVEQPVISIPNPSEDREGEWLEVRFTNMRDGSGILSGMVALLRDTTFEVRIEKKRQLFLSNVSHELRTPLTVISSYLESLDDGAINDPELARTFIKTSIEESNRLIRMVNELLEISRINREDFQEKKEIVNLQNFMDYHIGRLQQVLHNDPVYSKRGFRIVTDFPNEEVWVEMETDKAGQVVDNLVTNALKYSPNGGTIRIGMKIEGDLQDKIHLWISDEGLGIPKKELPKIFDRFYRVDASRNSKIPGTGLGLSLVQDIIELHNGRIYAESDGVSGTTIHMLLPYDHHLMDDIDNDF
ncbi:ATP-binding protein [Lactococcus termiticola]|uniref:histidine kinase n=1 Tax=Lactococcus termiticola TaxID=2169526 RepID=A0A2R5HJ30_9LACT|nr:ATP-binding protein [Lactococcus termiticola]GBG96480.1 two-component system sensor histidine kinase [Lactococcus termiticola]